MNNNRHTVKVSNGDKTLVLTFASRKAAWAAYVATPKTLDATLPERERHAVYKDADEALETVKTFFHI